MAFRRAISPRPRNFFKIPPRPPRLSAPLGVLFPAGRRCAPESWVRSAIRPYPGFPFAWIFRHSRAPSDFRVSLCTAEDCHGYNKFSPWLCASVRAPSHFLPFAGPNPQKNLTPAIEQIPPTTVGGTPTLLEPPPQRLCALPPYCATLRLPPWATHLSFPLDMRYRAGVRVIRGHLHPSGAALRAVCAASRRSNFVLIPHPEYWNPLRGFVAERVGLIPAFGLHPSGAALRSVCAASRRSNFVLIPHTWRRGWDSNPRDLAVLRFSRPAH